MTKREKDKFRNQLQALATRVHVTANSAEEQARSAVGGEAAGNLSNAPLHLGDVGSEAYSQELGATLLENEQYLEGEIGAALDRIEKGSFGKCESCNKSIPLERLEALPYARHCVPCASRSGNGAAVNLNNGRPSNWTDGLGFREEGPPEDSTQAANRPSRETVDSYAAGTPGGGTAIGGLAGTNLGRGDPDSEELEEAMGSGKFDVDEAGDDTEMDNEDPKTSSAFAGLSGGAVGGTPANKRATGGKQRRKSE
jgi:RNA polymerase-binding transcription factor DksA